MRCYSNWKWHLDEVFVKINGETHYMWRAVDHEGEVLKAFVTKRRDRKAALKFLKKIDESLRSTRKDRHRQAAFLRYGNEENRKRGSEEYRALAQQPNREFTSAIPKKRARHVPLPANAKFAEIRRGPFFNPQLFQFGAQPLQQARFQGQPCRCSHRLATTRRGKEDNFTVRAETSSNPSDTSMTASQCSQDHES